MKTPKRKAPEKKPARPVAGPVFGVGAAALGVAAARPGLTGGVLVFAIVFGMISANALWYQPGGHPYPILRTREPGDRQMLLGFQRPDEPENVTTFRIERPAAAPEPANVTDLLRDAASELTVSVQQELARLGLYQGAADGKAGPRTASAILAFQKSMAMPETGEASDGLLMALRAAKPAQASAQTVTNTQPAVKAEEKRVAPAVAVPPMRPTVIPAKAEALDPVAEAIRKAEKLTPPASIPNVATAAKPQPISATADSALVMQIQRGLSKLAYSHVTVNGVANATTREAIRNFEKAYRLPETGEPSARVLKKLKDIGAL